MHIPARVLYTVALLEWFETLAVEVLAIRLATPIVWSSIILTSVVLWVILLALSSGYYIGWRVADSLSHKALIPYTALSLGFGSIYYGLLSFPFLQEILERLLHTTQHYILSLFIVAVVLFFLPVVIASQTIPLLTELLPIASKGKAAWTMLFVSTIGSFLWSIVPSIILFEKIGVQATSLLVCIIGVIASGLLLSYYSKRSAVLRRTVTGTGIIIAYLLRYAPSRIAPWIIYSFNSAYQEIVVREWHVPDRPVRIFMTNRAHSSWIYTDTKTSPFDYIQETMRITTTYTPKRILVIGTAGFTYPYEAAQLPFVEHIDAVDIDPRVKHIAQEYFLQEPLSPKITFIPRSARYVVNQAQQNNHHYDLIFVDAYNGRNIPEELTTLEFFKQLQEIQSENGIIVFNFIHDSFIKSDFSHNLYTTLNEAYWTVYTKNVTQNLMIEMDNFVVSPTQIDETYTEPSVDGHLYTDNKRTTEIDSVAMREQFE